MLSSQSFRRLLAPGHLDVICWSSLTSGDITGKYRHSDLGPGPDGATTSRKQVAAGRGFLTPRGLDVQLNPAQQARLDRGWHSRPE